MAFPVLADLPTRGIALVRANVNDQPLSLIRRAGFKDLSGAETIVPALAAAFDAEGRPVP